MSTKHRTNMPLSRTDAFTFQSSKEPAFVQAVNRAANLKILAAIKIGKLRLVVPPKSQTSARYTPRMDIVDDPSSSNLTAIFELPGIRTSDIQLSISDGAITICGERRASYPTRTDPLPQDPMARANALASGEDTDMDPPPAQGTKVYVQELCFGTFQRTIRIARGIKDVDVKANLQDGMLTVTWPKSPVIAESPKAPRNASSLSPPMPMLAAGTASQ